MAEASLFLVCNCKWNPLSLSLYLPLTLTKLRPSPSFLNFSTLPSCRKLTVLTRAGPSTSSYVFAFALPLSLLAVTVFTSIRIADKLDRDFLEDMAMNEAIMEVDDDEEEEEEEEEDMETYGQDEPALPRARRNRPKRDA